MAIARILRIALFGLAALAVIARYSHAETLKIVTLELPPYGFFVGGQATGVNYDLGNIIARKAGFKPINTIVPLARAVQDIAAGEADMVIMLPSPTIKQYAMSLGKFPPVESIVIGLFGSNPNSIDDIKDKTIGVVRGAKYDEQLSMEHGINVYPLDNYSHGFKMLLDKRIDYVAGPILGLIFTAEKDGISNDKLGKPLVLSETQAHLFLSTKHANEDMRKRLSEAMQRIIDDGTYRRLRAQYSF